MSVILQIVLLLGVFFFVFIVLYSMRIKDFSYKYGILWIFFSLILSILVVFPNVLEKISQLMRIETAVNALFLMIIFILIVIIFFLTMGYSKNAKKIKKLVQEIALINKEIEEYKEKMKSL